MFNLNSLAYLNFILTLIALLLLTIAIGIWFNPISEAYGSRDPIPVYIVSGPYSSSYLDVDLNGAIKVRVIDSCSDICRSTR